MSGPPSSDYLVFEGRSWIRNYGQKFSVLCGDNPPTITDGYALWQTIPRPLSTGVTLFTGYNPPQMQCELRFAMWDSGGSWDTTTAGGSDVESRISILEWMAGANFGTGRSPVVRVYSYKGDNTLSDLVPPAWRYVTWIIGSGTASGLEWGQAWRNEQGQRIWQDVKVTLTKYVGYDQAPKAGTQQNGTYMVASPSADTPLKMAANTQANMPMANQELLARLIVSDPHNSNLQLRSVRQQVPQGSRVWVPSGLTSPTQTASSQLAST